MLRQSKEKSYKKPRIQTKINFFNIIDKQVLELKKFVPPPERKRVKANLIKDFTSIARADSKGRKGSKQGTWMDKFRAET